VERHTHLRPSLRFGPFELDVGSAELRHNGRKTLLHEQPFQVLLALLERPGELISREELVHRLWPDGTFVDYERGLNKAVNKLRDALHDSADSPRFVETIPRRGYRFIAPLEGGSAITMASDSPVAVKAGRQHKIWLAMGVALMFLLMAAVGYSVYSFLSHKGAVPYENFAISQITNTGKTMAAAISPDGKFLLSVMDDHGKQSLWLRNISTNSDAQVIPSEDARYLDPAFSPDGNYIYFRKDVSYIEAIDMLRAPVLGGSPQVIVHDVDTAFTFSPAGMRMAYVRNNPEIGKFQVLMANAEGTDEKMLSGGLSSAIPNAIAWSPDGNQIASAIPGLGDALGTIQLQDVISAKTQTLGRFNEEFGDLTWLPDGRGLLATYRSPAVRGSQVGFISYPGGQFRTVTKDTNSYQTLTLSADGKTLVTVQQKSSQTLYLMPAAGFTGQPPHPAPAQNKDSFYFGWASNGDLYFDNDVLRISADGSKTTRLLRNPTGQITGLVSCAAGRYVLVRWAGRDGSKKSNIWRLDSNGSNPKQLTDGVLDLGPRCSPDGAWVYYFDGIADQMKRVQIDGGTPEIVPGTVIRSAYYKVPAISPDGKLLAFEAAMPGSTQIALVNLDAGAEPPRRMIVPDPRISGFPQFTPDGKAVVYGITENGVANLWLQSLDGSRGRQITNFQSDQIAMFEFSPNGKTLGVLRSHTESDVVLLRDIGSSPQ